MRPTRVFGSLLLLGSLFASGAAKNRVTHVAVDSTVPELRVGSLTLHRCETLPGYCGKLPRPLDPSGQFEGTINIGFEFFLHTDRRVPALETIVANEGGPGYPSTGSESSYVQLFAPLMNRHDLLLVDQRGTGLSESINCPLLQNEPNPKVAGVAACGKQLGNTSYLYGSGLSADDLAAVLDELNIPTIDLYGDSYGTFFSQTFAGRHPERLRALVLDSAYPVIGQSPWYPEAARAARQALDYACRRSETCRNLPGGTSLGRIETLVESLRAHPFAGWAHDGNGVLRYTNADPTSLAYLIFSNATSSVVYRELDPAARDYLENGESEPLLRLLAENYVAGQSAGGTPPDVYSAGLFVSVSCTDYPQIYDMSSDFRKRVAERNRSFEEEEENDPRVYAPFTISEFNAIPLDSSVLDLCLSWPVPVLRAYPPGQPVPAGTQFTSAPVLVLSGDLDSLTPAEQAANATRLFEHAKQIVLANSFHVTALGDEDNCASELVRRFVRNLNPGDASCASHVAEVHVLPKFASSSAQLAPATARAGNDGTEGDLQVVSAAAYAVGDALTRWWVNDSGDGVGLRGGKFHYDSDNPTTFLLDKLKWVDDVEVSGTISWNYNYPGGVTAKLNIGGSGTPSGELLISWQERVPGAHAKIVGKIGDRKIAAVMYAP
jgi:pimeloyl-ACP methyl ester carboxylesterase